LPQIINIPKLKYHSGQLAVVKQIQHGLKHGVRQFVWEAGRRVGKTTLNNDILLTTILGGGNAGMWVPTHKDGEAVWGWFRNVLGGKKSALIHTINSATRSLRLTTGGTFDMWSLDSEGSGRGFQYDVTVIDEGAKARHLSLAMKEAILPTMTDTDGWLLITSTPRGFANHFHVLYEKGQERNAHITSFRTPSYANPYIPREVLLQRKQELESEGFAWIWEQEYLAKPARKGNNPFDLDVVDRQLQYEQTNEDVIAWSVDLAKKMDYTVVLGFDKNCKIAQYNRWTGRPWPETEKNIIKITKRFPSAPIIADTTGSGEALVDYLLKAGLPVRRWLGTSKTKPILMREYRIALEKSNAWILIGQHEKELRAAEYIEGRNDFHVYVPRPMHDDVLMCAAMGTTLLNQMGYPRRPPKKHFKKKGTAKTTKRMNKLKNYR